MRNKDKRPRFGYCDDLDEDPQYMRENRELSEDQYVAVIPLPNESGALRQIVRNFAKLIRDTK